jgi:hypothetical protein
MFETDQQAFGLGSVAQSVLSREQAGSMLSINLAWGWTVSMAIWAAGGISGKLKLRPTELRIYSSIILLACLRYTCMILAASLVLNDF